MLGSRAARNAGVRCRRRRVGRPADSHALAGLARAGHVVVVDQAAVPALLLLQLTATGDGLLLHTPAEYTTTSDPASSIAPPAGPRRRWCPRSSRLD